MEKINNLEISESSKKVYKSILKRFEKYNFNIDSKITMIKINKLLSNVEKTSSKLDLLNLIIVIGDINEKTMEQIKQLRKDLQHERLDNNIKTMNDKKKILMNYETFEEKLNELFDKKKYKAYLLNYLMYIYGLRNLDLNIIICHKKCNDIDPKKNYLIMSGKKILFIRNVYKTAKKYGPKENILTFDNTDTKNKIFESISHIPEGPIINQDNTVGNELRKLLILKEADVFKMIINHYYKKEDTEKINELSSSRGTSIETIKNFYNINAEKEIIREI
tara:strand:- start:1164 stop:1994 length:831 start_codon:yes stop_codon:yes gene_type:complete